jgi:hypothetical protein
LGAVVTAFLAILVVPDWRIMFVVGAVAGFVLVPFLWFRLPETLPPVQTEHGKDAREATAPAAPAPASVHTARTHRPIGRPGSRAGSFARIARAGRFLR